MKVALITPTGTRPEAFALCMKYVERQTYRQFEWIVIDDGEEPVPLSNRYKRITPKPSWQPGQNTLVRNLLEGFEAIEDADLIIFIEDDDWYHAQYVEKIVDHFLKVPWLMAVGENKAMYYHVPTRQYYYMRNLFHASLCQTVIRKEVLPLFKQAMNEVPHMLDVRFWDLIRAKALPYRLIDGDLRRMSVGIKGLPGRKGIGMGHNPDKGWLRDPEGSMLKNFVGEEDAQIYLQMRGML